MNRNHVELSGHLGADPEVRNTPKGRGVAILSLATNEKWGEGEGTQRTEWHRVVAWGPTADFCRDNLKRGYAVFLEGALHTNTWEKDGKKQYRTEVHVKPGTIQILNGRKATEPSESPKSTDDVPSEDLAA
jgi:single-strand DNA-binding protein